MTEALVVLGALLGFCILTFGTVWAVAAWMRGTPLRWREKRRGRR